MSFRHQRPLLEGERDPRVSRYAVLQSVTEIGVGSLVHSLHLPLGGHFLSLNQNALLVLASRPVPSDRSTHPRKRAVFVASGVSFVSALLKGLSPAGKRAMPMLAIAIQGVLFSLGFVVFGANILGAVLGAVLLSVWGFLQPLIFAYLVFGKTLFEGVSALWADLVGKLGWNPEEAGLWLLGAVVGVKAIAAIIVTFLAWGASPERETAYVAWMRKVVTNGSSSIGSAPVSTGHGPRKSPAMHPALAALLDLVRPIFLVSLAISLGFVIFSQPGKTGEVFSYLGRTLAVAWIIFFAIRAFPAEWSAKVLDRFPSLREAANQVLGKS